MLREEKLGTKKEATSIWNTLCTCIHRCFYPNIAFYKKIIIKNLGFVIKWSIQFPIANCHKIDCLTRTASLNSLCFCLFCFHNMWFHEKLLLDLLLNTKKHIALKCEAIANRIKLMKNFLFPFICCNFVLLVCISCLPCFI